MLLLGYELTEISCIYHILQVSFPFLNGYFISQMQRHVFSAADKVIWRRIQSESTYVSDVIKITFHSLKRFAYRRIIRIHTMNISYISNVYSAVFSSALVEFSEYIERTFEASEASAFSSPFRSPRYFMLY